MRSFVGLQRSNTWSRSLLQRSRNRRGSRRLTRNQEDDEWHETTIDLSGNFVPQALIEIKEQKSIRESSIHCACSNSVGCVSWKETAHTRKNSSVFRKTVLSHISNTRKGIVLKRIQRRQILLVPITNKIISEKWFLRNTFGYKVFSYPRTSTLDDVDMSLTSAQ